jgi:hypothetical protein
MKAAAMVVAAAAIRVASEGRTIGRRTRMTRTSKSGQLRRLGGQRQRRASATRIGLTNVSGRRERRPHAMKANGIKSGPPPLNDDEVEQAVHTATPPSVTVTERSPDVMVRRNDHTATHRSVGATRRIPSGSRTANGPLSADYRRR